MIKLGTSDGNTTHQASDLHNSVSGSIRTLIVPKKLETDFILQCNEGEVLDPVKVIEMYLEQRKYELLEAVFARKKARLEAEYFPTYDDIKRLRRKKKGQRNVKVRARHILTNITKIKSVYCHSMPDEDAFGKIKRHSADI